MPSMPSADGPTVTDLVVVPQPGDPHARPGWTVHTSWRASGEIRVAEFSETHPDWPTARRVGLKYACLAGVRYVTVCGPDDVVRGDWDRYTNRWREYRRPGAEKARP